MVFLTCDEKEYLNDNVEKIPSIPIDETVVVVKQQLLLICVQITTSCPQLCINIPYT